MSISPTTRPAETGTAALGTAVAACLGVTNQGEIALIVLAVSYAPALITTAVEFFHKRATPPAPKP